MLLENGAVPLESWPLKQPLAGVAVLVLLNKAVENKDLHSMKMLISAQPWSLPDQEFTKLLPIFRRSVQNNSFSFIEQFLLISPGGFGMWNGGFGFNMLCRYATRASQE